MKDELNTSSRLRLASNYTLIDAKLTEWRNPDSCVALEESMYKMIWRNPDSYAALEESMYKNGGILIVV